VKFQKYPFHNSRRVVVTVGGLCVFEAMWDAAGKDGALNVLKAIGEEVSELIDALGKVEV
jgi:polyphosphate kinase 2 (PPK2 family)